MSSCRANIRNGSQEKKSLLRYPGGFTLLEVLVAMSILAITFVAVFGAQSASISKTIKARFYTIAPMLTDKKLAELQAGLTELSNSTGDFGTNYPGFSWTIESEKVGTEALSILGQLKHPITRVTLEISWIATSLTYTVVYYDRDKPT